MENKGNDEFYAPVEYSKSRVSPRLAPVTSGTPQVANALSSSSASNDISTNAQNILDN